MPVHLCGCFDIDFEENRVYMHGITNIYIPKENFHELRSVQKRIKSTLSIHLVNHYEEVLDDLWMN